MDNPCRLTALGCAVDHHAIPCPKEFGNQPSLFRYREGKKLRKRQGMLIFRPQFQSELALGEGPKAIARRGSIAQDRVSNVIVHGDPLPPVSCLLDLSFGQDETRLLNSSLFQLLKKSIRDPCTIGGRVDDDDNLARRE